MTPNILRKCDVVRKALERLELANESPSLDVRMEQRMAWALQADNVREILEWVEQNGVV